MVTLVGTERDLPEMLDNLAQLDLDARESYDAALPGVEPVALRTMLKAFKEDHQKQADALAGLLEGRGHTPTTGPGTKQIVGTSAVTLANVIGNQAILQALARCEQDAIAAYERAVGFAERDQQVQAVLEAGLDCFRRHQDSFDQMLKHDQKPGELQSPGT